MKQCLFILQYTGVIICRSCGSVRHDPNMICYGAEIVMAKQNIYDNPVFFEGYKKLREKTSNANDLFEIPALFSLLPALKGKAVLDLGCGFGEHCKAFVKKGAAKVVGIDISEKMIREAETVNRDPAITYMHLPMEDLDKMDGTFDVVVSSLAFHYVKDFSGVIRMIYEKTNMGGVLVFSQENPLCTSHSDGDRWTRDENGNKLYLTLYSYGVEGERKTKWFVDGVEKYHRMFSTIINTLIEAGFTVEKMTEPLPDEKLLKNHPEYCDLFHKPDFLVVRARKQECIMAKGTVHSEGQ